MAVVSVHDLMP